MIKEVSLCSGIGGFSLGFEWAKFAEPIMFCDFDEWCRKVLKKNWKDIPTYNDVKEIANDPRRFISSKINKGEKWVLTSGYPCQPFSVSGNRRGEEDPRHIFPYIHRIVEQTRPTYCVFENVYGHVSMGLDEVLFEMERINYHTRQFVVSASSVGARHKRDRLWIICKNVGDTEYNGCSTSEIGRGDEEVARGSQKRSEETEQSKGASGQEDNGSLRNELSNSNNKGIRSCLGGNDIDLQKESGERRDDGTRGSSNDERSNLRPPRMKEWKYPTPNAGLVKHSYNGNHEYYKKRLRDGRQVDLAHKIFQEEGDGRLNANWTEWLMGYPIGWTNLEESQESQSNKKTDLKD